MSDEARLQQLQQLQQRFCDAVNRGEWIEAATLQDERFALIDALLATPRLRTPQVAGALREIAASDARMLPALDAARDDAAAQLRELQRGRKALAAYAHTP